VWILLSYEVLRERSGFGELTGVEPVDALEFARLEISDVILLRFEIFGTFVVGIGVGGVETEVEVVDESAGNNAVAEVLKDALLDAFFLNVVSVVGATKVPIGVGVIVFFREEIENSVVLTEFPISRAFIDLERGRFLSASLETALSLISFLISFDSSLSSSNLILARNDFFFLGDGIAEVELFFGSSSSFDSFCSSLSSCLLRRFNEINFECPRGLLVPDFLESVFFFVFLGYCNYCSIVC